MLFVCWVFSYWLFYHLNLLHFEMRTGNVLHDVWSGQQRRLPVFSCSDMLLFLKEEFAPCCRFQEESEAMDVDSCGVSVIRLYLPLTVKQTNKKTTWKGFVPTVQMGCLSTAWKKCVWQTERPSWLSAPERWHGLVLCRILFAFGSFVSQLMAPIFASVPFWHF